MTEYNLLSSFMTSVGFFFVYLPLTSDEINNVVRLSSREDGKFYEPRTIPRERFCHACGNTSDRNRGTRQETPLYPFGFASAMTNIFLTIVLHRTTVGFQVALQKEKTAGETILPKPRKTLREGRGVSAYLTELDSDYMINSLLS